MRTFALPALLLLATVAVIVALDRTGPRSAGPPHPIAPPVAPSGVGTGHRSAERDDAGETRYSPADLFSPDEGRALAASARLSPDGLTLEELRRQQALLVEHPKLYFKSRADWGIGNRELPRLLLRTAEEGVVYLDHEDRPRLIDTHRVWLPSSMDLLVEALGRSGPETFPHFLEYLNHVAQVSGDNREAAAHGFLYAIDRLYREKRGERPDGLGAFYVDRPERGLPEAFVRLARFTWLDPDSRKLLGDRLWPLPPAIFLLRWGRELEPLPADSPFLLDLARRGSLAEARAWAVTALAKLDSAGADAAIRDIARGEEGVAAIAAAALARKGETARLRAILESGAAGGLTGALYLKHLPGETPPEFFPDGMDRAHLLAWWGIEITDAELAAHRRADLEADSRRAALGCFYSGTWPEGLSEQETSELVAALRDFEPREEEYSPWVEPDVLARMFAPLEVRTRDRLTALLAHWVREGPDQARPEALYLLARLGDARFVPEMIESWRRITGSGDWFIDGVPPLGRVKDPRVLAFLTRTVRSGEGVPAGEAIRALAEYHGLPPELADMIFKYEDQPADPAGREAVRLLLEGDAVGAALRLEENLGGQLALLGLVDDPRVRDHLRLRRAERVVTTVGKGGEVSEETVYWEATAGLALLGDPEARAEVVGAIEDGRTWIVEIFDWYGIPTLRGDPGLVELWISRIDSNCCHGLLALASLSSTFPLLDIGYDLNDMAEVRRRIASWYERNRGRFGWSRLVDGWVPK